MYEIIAKWANEHFYANSLIVTICVAAITVAMIIDLISGIQKAKANGTATTSTGLKKTCEKAKKYFAPMLVLICVDLITCSVLPVPAFTMLWSVFVCFCEFKSIREKAWEKADIRKAEKTMNIIVDNKDDIAKMVADLLKSDKEQKRVYKPRKKRDEDTIR